MATIYLREFPEELHHQAKIQAAVEKLHLKDLFAKALTEYLKRAGAPVMGAEHDVADYLRANKAQKFAEELKEADQGTEG